MDPISVAFYAVICGTLSAFAPKSLGFVVRFLIGGGVGVCAALILPFLKGVIGGY
jgi:hypothetical protein